MLAMNLYGWPPSSSVALVIAITCISALPSPTHQDGPASCLGVCAKARTRPYLPLKLKCLAIRGGEGSEYADLSVSTPSGESELCKWSYQSSSGPSSSGLALQKGSEGSSSTGLGIHNRNWSHVKAIGLPCFEYSEFNRVAKEAKLLRHAADGAYEAQGYRTEEKKRSLKELQRRREIAEDGKKKGWFQDGEGERIEGEPCSVCQKILCTCEFEKEQVTLVDLHIAGDGRNCVRVGSSRNDVCDSPRLPLLNVHNCRRKCASEGSKTHSRGSRIVASCNPVYTYAKEYAYASTFKCLLAAFCLCVHRERLGCCTVLTPCPPRLAHTATSRPHCNGHSCTASPLRQHPFPQRAMLLM
jgi:hypothetical protein